MLHNLWVNSLVEAPKVENKMGDSVPCLQESVSFGRFEHDSLCWERWSTFPTNKYLEEVEKCSTPGSVAQKKAYFEAHYKKIAARKAELLDQEKKRETESMNSEDQSQTSMGSVCNPGEEELDSEKSVSQNLATGTELANEEVGFMGEVTDAHFDVPGQGAEMFNEETEVSNVTSEVSEHTDEPIDSADIADENEELQPQVMDASEDLCPKMEKPEELGKEFTSTLDSQDMEELPQDKVEAREMVDKEADDVLKLDGSKKLQEELAQDKVEERGLSEVEAEDVNNLDSSKKTQEKSPQDKVEEREVKKENEDLVKSENSGKLQKELLQDKVGERQVAKKETKDLVTLANPKKMQRDVRVKKTTSTANAKKKPASLIPKRSSPMPKSPMLSTPKSTKPALSKTAMSTTRPSVKKENGSPPLTSKKATGPESKKVLPTSLHMSLSLGPTNSDPAALATTRKSLIMERMGDKDIVKRAFKAFQNFSPVSPSSLTKAPATNQFANKKMEKGSAMDASQKRHEERITRAVKPSSAVPGQVGTKKTAVSPGLHKTVGMDQRNGKSLPASLGLRSQDKGHKHKEASKNLEQKPKTKEAGMTHHQSKVKLERPIPVKTPRQDINSKAKLSTSHNEGYGFLKGLRKDGTKIQASG